jgi:hypothetical protein
MSPLVWRGVLTWVVVLVAVRLVVLQPERCGEATAGDVRQAAAATTAWLVTNQATDGSWLYRYDRRDDVDLGGYNTVRHAGAVVALEQAATAGHQGAAEAAARGTDWALARTAPVAGGRALLDDATPDLVPSGASGLWLAALAERRLRTGDDVHDELMRDLARFLVAMVTDDGAVLGRFDRTLDQPVPESWSMFYTGEVFWALADLHRLFPDEGFDEPAERIATYLATARDEVEGWWPTIPDHWAAYGFASMTRWPDREPDRPFTVEQVDYLRHQAELQSAQIRYESQRTDSWWTHLTRGRPTLGAGLGTVGEGLTQLWVAAGADERLADLRPAIDERARCTAGVMVERQVGADEADRWPDPDRTFGAFFQFDITQVDDQQHTLSALVFLDPILGGEP